MRFLFNRFILPLDLSIQFRGIDRVIVNFVSCPIFVQRKNLFTYVIFTQVRIQKLLQFLLCSLICKFALPFQHLTTDPYTFIIKSYLVPQISFLFTLFLNKDIFYKTYLSKFIVDYQATDSISRIISVKVIITLWKFKLQWEN